jgi:uncharacterized membrane protein
MHYRIYVHSTIVGLLYNMFILLQRLMPRQDHTRCFRLTHTKEFQIKKLLSNQNIYIYFTFRSWVMVLIPVLSDYYSVFSELK